MNVDHLIETCVPGGDLCDPQVVADNIRRYFSEQSPEPSTTLPTEPGLYWWREDEKKKWVVVKVSNEDSRTWFEQILDYAPVSEQINKDEWMEHCGIGQWLPCLPPGSEARP